MPGQLRVFIASSLDGFIAGHDDDLSWLPSPSEGNDYGYAAFFAGVGALLMGRRTYDIAAGDPGPWPYGDRPVLVVTTRPIEPRSPTVRAVRGTLAEIVAEARAAAGERDVYVDGGNLIRQLIDADLIDDLTVSLVPVLLGAGYPLFAGVKQPHKLELVASKPCAELVQLTYRPQRNPEPDATAVRYVGGPLLT